MNLCIDKGNSSTKIGVFDNNTLLETITYSLNEKWDVLDLCEKYGIQSCILSSVVNNNEQLLNELTKILVNVIELDYRTSLPITNNYKTPKTLGKDRLAAVVGANYLQPNCNLLVVDIGTAITYDFIDENNIYWGGNIAPGIDLRLRSLHEFTQKLPLVEVQDVYPMLGYDTNSAMLAGTFNGIAFEIDGYINLLKIKYIKLSTFLTGGSVFYFDTKLKNAIFAEKNLVLIGLNRILQYNVQN